MNQTSGSTMQATHPGRGLSSCHGLASSTLAKGLPKKRAYQGPKLSNLRSCRWTIADGIQTITDNWENDIGELEVNGGLVEWVGKVIFYERWASEDANGNAEDTE